MGCAAADIRAATLEDQSDVVALWTVSDLVVSHNDPRKDFHFALGKPNSDVLVAVSRDGRLTGSVMVGHDGHRGWVYYLAVDPECRKQGIGRRLIDAAEGWLRERGVPKIMLMVRETNTQVVEFYHRLDFEDAPRLILQKWL